MSSIILSEKHGVNPSIEKCFYCGNDKGIILFGKLKGDEHAPKEVINDLTPCEKCSPLIREPEKNHTVILIENDGTVTGKYAIVKDEKFLDFINENDNKRIFFVKSIAEFGITG